MINRNFTFKSQEGLDIFVYRWGDIGREEVKGVVQIAHGMAERAGRYERLARELNKNGYIVYANDHRGHGKTAGDIDNLGYLGDGEGFNLLVEDMYKLSSIIRKENPKLPLFLLGHSMGSFASQKYLIQYGNKLDGLILSGSNGDQGIKLKLGRFLSKLEIRRIGPRGKSPRLDRLVFGKFNKAFRPNRTEFDWLSRDRREVDRYIKDPYCGTIFTSKFFYDFFKGLEEIEDRKNLKLIPKNLPIYIFAGDKDPVGNFGKGIINLYKRYKDLGIRDLRYRLYKDGRHEMLNEINRNEVTNDLIQWLDKQIIS